MPYTLDQKALEVENKVYARDIEAALTTAYKRACELNALGRTEDALALLNMCFEAKPEQITKDDLSAALAPPPPRPAALSAIAFAAVARREAGDASSRSSSESVLRVSVVPAPAFPLPRALCERVGAGGEELGVACGHVFAGHDGKGAGGAVGCLTRGGVSRAQLYAPAVRLALVPFVGPALAFDLPTLAP